MLRKYLGKGAVGKLYLLRQVIRVILNRLNAKLSAYIVSRIVQKCGKNLTVKKMPLIMYPQNVEIGNNCYIGENVVFSTEIETASLKIGDNVTINDYVKIDYTGDVTIGKGTLISSGSGILSHDHGKDPRNEPIPKPIELGEKVWLGQNVLVLQNVQSIGSHSVVGAGCVVSKRIGTQEMVVSAKTRLIK